MTNTTQAIEKIEATRQSFNYLAAMKVLHLGQDKISTWAADRSCSEYGDLRFVVSQWDIIGNSVSQALAEVDPAHLESEQTKMFHGVPVLLIWNLLAPGIAVIRDEPSHGNFGSAFEGLKNAYERWQLSASGSAFGSEEEQAISARFG